jgi:hypothetical protein
VPNPPAPAPLPTRLPAPHPQGFVSQGNLDNLVVSSDASDLLECLGRWKPVLRGLVLTSEERKGAIGEDVSGRA